MNKTLRLLGAVLIPLISGWVAILLIMEFSEFKFVKSENNCVGAIQYLFYLLWAIACVTSPAWWLVISVVGIKKLMVD